MLEKRVDRIKVQATRWASAVFGAAVLTFSIWALSPPIFGQLEPWDTPYPFYSLASLVGGALLGFAVPRHFVACFLGAWAGQIAALLFLPGHDQGWLELGLLTTGIGSVVLATGAAIGSRLRGWSAA